MKMLGLCLALMSTFAWGQEVCTRNAPRIDVCRVATDLAQTIASELPLRLSQSLVLRQIESSANLIKMSAVFDYTESHLTKTLKAGTTLDTMKTSVRDAAVVMACRPKTELQAFIDLGGELQFIYLFSDKAHFLTVNVDHCTPEQGTKAAQ